MSSQDVVSSGALGEPQPLCGEPQPLVEVALAPPHISKLEMDGCEVRPGVVLAPAVACQSGRGPHPEALALALAPEAVRGTLFGRFPHAFLAEEPSGSVLLPVMPDAEACEEWKLPRPEAPAGGRVAHWGSSGWTNGHPERLKHPPLSGEPSLVKY